MRRLRIRNYSPDNNCQTFDVAAERITAAFNEGYAENAAENENDTGPLQRRPADNAAQNAAKQSNMFDI